jgi:hypothetical protein
MVQRYHGRQDKVVISTETLLCYYSDIHPSNFAIDKHGQLWVIDIGYAGVLTSSFMNDAIASHSNIRKTIPLLSRRTWDH